MNLIYKFSNARSHHITDDMKRVHFTIPKSWYVDGAFNQEAYEKYQEKLKERFKHIIVLQADWENEKCFGIDLITEFETTEFNYSGFYFKLPPLSYRVFFPKSKTFKSNMILLDSLKFYRRKAFLKACQTTPFQLENTPNFFDNKFAYNNVKHYPIKSIFKNKMNYKLSTDLLNIPKEIFDGN